MRENNINFDWNLLLEDKKIQIKFLSGFPEKNSSEPVEKFHILLFQKTQKT